MPRSKSELLEIDRWSTQQWLSCFDIGTGPQPVVSIGPSGETFIVSGFPCPDKYQSDSFNLALVVRDYPQDPPKGIYLLTTDTNRALISHLKGKFNVFQDSAAHGAPSIQGYEWICVGYLNSWKFNASAPHKGDNITKMLQNFWRLLEE